MTQVQGLPPTTLLKYQTKVKRGHPEFYVPSELWKVLFSLHHYSSIQIQVLETQVDESDFC